MFNIGSKEFLILLFVALILFGGKKLVELSKDIGKSTKQLKKAKKEFSKAIGETDEDIITPKEAEVGNKVSASKEAKDE